MFQILPFPRRGNMVAARDHVDLQELAVIDQLSWAPSPLGSLRIAKPAVQCSFAMLSILPIGTMTSVKYTVSLNALFSDCNGKHQCFYLHVPTMISTLGHFLSLNTACDKIHRKCHGFETKNWCKKLNQQLLDIGETKTEGRAMSQEALFHTTSPLGAYGDIPQCYQQMEMLLSAEFCLTEVNRCFRSGADSQCKCTSALDMPSCSAPQPGTHRGAPKSALFLSGLMICRVSVNGILPISRLSNLF